MTSPADPRTATAIRWAAVVSGGMITFQVASKATRDALFLSSYDVTRLPLMIMAAAAVALAVAVGSARLLARFGPGRVVPASFVLSAALQFLEWWLAAAFPRAIAVTVFLHYNALGALLISGFWSVLNERFDPRTAKRVVGPVGAAGTIGGLAGGLLAERVAAWGTVTTMLPLLGLVHLVCAAALLPVRSAESLARSSPEPSPSGTHILTATPYLRVLIGIVLLATIAEGALDFVFKAQARSTFGRGEELLRLFAGFYTVVSLLSVLVQTTFARQALERIGIARTASLLPWSVAVGGGLALAAPGLMGAALARGIEAVMRNSLYRASYELLFTPLTPLEKRRAKPLVDIGVVRVGDAIAAGVIQAALMLIPGAAQTALLALAVAAAAAAIAMTFDLHAGYVATLETSLRHRAVELDLDAVDDATTRSTLLQTIGFVGSGTLRVADVAAEHAPAPATAAAALPARAADPLLGRIADLRSRDAARVRRAIAAAPFDAVMASHVIPLLAWDDVAPEVLAALKEAAPRITGQLADTLLDAEQEFTVRRRIPAALAEAGSERALIALIRGLEDRRFEVRFRCGRALGRLAAAHPELAVPEQRVVEAVLREVAVDREVWQSQRLLDRHDDEGSFADDVIRDRASRSLEHVFTVMALIMPRRPLELAFRALHSGDAHLRGTALEYLETSLPPAIREKLWPFVDDQAGRRVRPARSRDQIVADLVRSNDSLALGIEAARKRHSDG